MPPRLRGWDYGATGAYFVTACTYRRRPHFGVVDAGRVSLSPLGRIVRDCVERVFAARPHSNVEASVVMPDHVHILVLRDSNSALLPLDLLVRDVKARVTHEARARAMVGPHEHLWQRGYFDRIVRSQEEHDALRAYIDTNPMRWTLRRQRAST
jgi:REP element-mobilizing transposase RayT